MPYWAVVIIIVVLVVAYYTSTSYAREKRRDSVGRGFEKIPNFHANQVFVDVRGEAALGIDDRARRLAIARKRGEPRVRTYSFAQLTSAEVVQNGAVIATTTGGGPTPASGSESSLFGSTRAAGGRSAGIKPAPGPLTTLAVRAVFADSPGEDLVVRFYQGKGVDLESVAAEKAFGQARVCYGALDVAMRRGVLPPRPPATGTPHVSGSGEGSSTPTAAGPD